ncbi:Autophagy-like protein 22 [Tolypocladium ophioglossoides CBS 100239]|uniref:Autophagy-related protein n=1 Tax=Tolypocladium ophioglossoides (strain CBS 100239) TaxID=1163406 RepID=A0A0L0N8C6_TOLOC|nr:Autophagy-like protein 22 [Tolypocladium ophioglossoides CBS 100239]
MPSNPQPHRPGLQGRRLLSGLSILSKRSFRSYTTSSFEADDERSSSGGDMSPRDNDSDSNSDSSLQRPGAPSYVGHDARPTSRKELLGWYMYAFAAETYVICGIGHVHELELTPSLPIGSFIPILLESLARENGVLLSDPSRPCGSSDSKGEDDGQCVVYVLGLEINTASFAMYTFSVSVLVQALLVVSISCAADHGNYRKKLLLIFAWIGSFAVMAYIFVSRETYILGAILTIISNTSFGASFVLLNSFLPLLVRNHPEIIEARGPRTPDLADSGLESRPLEESTDELNPSMANSKSALLADEAAAAPGWQLKRIPTHEEITSTELQMSTRLSAQGIGIGYTAALFVQSISSGILVTMKNTTWSQRIVLFFIGAWWSVFTIPAAMWLRPRPGPPLMANGRKDGLSWISYLIYAWKSLFRTIKLARRLLDIMLFLAGWFLLSDAIATTSSTAILFAKTQLHMQPWALGMINVIVTLTGVLGAFGWSWVSRVCGLQAHQTILVCIALFELIPLYGLMGYLPFVQRWGVLGLQQPWEMYPLAAIYGLVMGGLSSYCRSLYGELIPPGSEAAFYALYAITDKGSSVFGPSIVGAIIDRTGSIRPAFWFLGAMVGLPAPLIWFINVERGKREGEKLAETIEGFTVSAEGEQHDEGEARGMMADYEDEGDEGGDEGDGLAASRRRT